MSDNTIIIGRPIKSGCAVNAVGNPIVYKLKREDAGFNQVNNVAGLAQFQTNGINLSTYYKEGDVVFIGRAGYMDTAVITASEFTGGNTLITTDHVFVDSGIGYMNNLSERTDYRIEVEVFDSETNASMGPRISATPATDGVVNINISGIVSSYLSADWSLVDVLTFEPESSKNVYIKFEEFFDGSYRGVETDESNIICCIFAMINLISGSPPNFKRYAYGGNMFPFVLGMTFESKFLTRFIKPSVWRGWPFTFSFINQDFTDISKRITQYDSQGDIVSDNAYPATLSGNGVYRDGIGELNNNTKEVVVSIQGVDDLRLTEYLTIKVKEPGNNPVLLFWKNSFDGDSFWVFDESQDYKYTYPSGRKVTRMTLYADNLTIDEWDAINELNSPTELIAANLTDYGMNDSIDKTHFRNDNQVYIVSQDGEKVGVVVIETESVTKTNQEKHLIEITIELPEIFTI